jgi:hypothetical protein
VPAPTFLQVADASASRDDRYRNAAVRPDDEQAMLDAFAVLLSASGRSRGRQRGARQSTVRLLTW